MFELSREREEKNKQKVDNLQAEVKHLVSIIELGQQNNSSQNIAVDKLIKLRDELAKSRDKLNEELLAFKDELYHKEEQIIDKKNMKLDLENDYKMTKKSLMEV